MAPSALTLEDALTTARARSARGNATRRDWEAVFALDRDVATEALRDFLLRANIKAAGDTNPYARRPRGWGAGVGFLLGCVVMAITWLLFPWFRDLAGDHRVLKDFATLTQFLSTLFVPLGAWIGVQVEHARRPPAAPTAGGAVLTRSSSWDEMLAMFESTQRRDHGRAAAV